MVYIRKLKKKKKKVSKSNVYMCGNNTNLKKKKIKIERNDWIC